MFSLQVVVSDSGYPALSSTAHVVIEILDQNDNKPEFLEKVYRTRLMAITEDSGKTSLLKVTAKDDDKGPNAQITYKIKGKKQIFGIERDTGMIFAKGALRVGSYNLKVYIGKVGFFYFVQQNPVIINMPWCNESTLCNKMWIFVLIARKITKVDLIYKLPLCLHCLNTHIIQTIKTLFLLKKLERHFSQNFDDVLAKLFKTCDPTEAQGVDN